MHVRRTDKIEQEEAKFIPSSVFWKAVLGAAGNRTAQTGRKREKPLIYISSEDIKVLPEFQGKFKDGEFVGAVGGISRDTQKSRYSDLYSVIRDIWILSKCDYVVGTFSSGVS